MMRCEYCGCRLVEDGSGCCVRCGAPQEGSGPLSPRGIMDLSYNMIEMEIIRRYLEPWHEMPMGGLVRQKMIFISGTRFAGRVAHTGVGFAKK